VKQQIPSIQLAQVTKLNPWNV